MSNKRNSSAVRQDQRDGLVRALPNNRYAPKRRSQRLVPVPGRLEPLLELVNLLPVWLRHPYWAQRETDKHQKSRFGLFEEEILHWQFGADSKEARFAQYLGKEIPEEWRANTPSLLWLKLQAVGQELPLALQAFVLHDEQGNKVEHEGQHLAVGVHPDLQSWRNISLIRESESELQRIVEEASNRIAKSIEDRLSGKRIPRMPDFDDPEELLERARHRLILLFGIQELLSYLMHPDRRDDLFFANTYYQSDAARSHFYIDSDCKIKFTPPTLVGVLEGIEATRIKECSFCFNFFWAGRSDMSCCSTRCGNAQRMRRHRERWGITKKSSTV